MDLREAFYKQKDELHALQRENRKLTKRIESATRSAYTDEIIKSQLSQMQGLRNKLSHAQSISDRYQRMYESKKKDYVELAGRYAELEDKNRLLQWQVDCLTGKRSFDGLTAAEDAANEIAALKDEVARLTARLNVNGCNAGIPSSMTAIGKKKPVPNCREKSDLKKGGQPGHPKHEMASFSEDEITDTEVHELESCPECGSHNLEETGCRIKDEFDYDVIVKKTRHRFIEYVCADCGKTVKAPYQGLVASNQYGSNIDATALSMMNLGFVSMNRTRRLIAGLAENSCILSEGYLAKIQRKYAGSLTAFTEDVKKSLLSLPLLYWDDTVVFVNTKRTCFRFYGDERFALYTAHEHKNLGGIVKDGILPLLTEFTTVMHDHNIVNYNRTFSFKNIECIQHLERDLQKISDASMHPWALELKEHIKATIHRRKKLIQAGSDSFSESEIDSIMSEIDEILKRAYQQWFADLGHYYETDEKALFTRIEIYRENYFAWIKDFSLPTSNNLSERSLRFVKVRDKVSGQFQSIEYASYFAKIRTYLETCRRNGINEHLALHRLTTGNPYTVAELISGNS